MDLLSFTDQPLDLHTQPNDGRGECLFLSICQALNSYEGVAADSMWEHLGRFGLLRGKVTSIQLRTLTYMLFLCKRGETDDILDVWRGIVTESPELCTEYLQAKFLAPKSAAELTTQERLNFFSACLNPAVCWGDETALMFLERMLCIRCIVITNRVVQCRQFTSVPDDFKPFVYVPLGLTNMHYESIVWMDASGAEHCAFSQQELPDILLFLCQRDCGKLPQDYINMRTACEWRRRREVGPPFDPGQVTKDAELTRHYALCRRVLLKSMR